MKEEKNPLLRITKYCAEAERCTKDVLDKLAAWNIKEEEWNPLLEELKKGKFLDDARYAMSFVSEKWKLNQWGKIKIRHHMEEKGIPPSLIEPALDSIDSAEYVQVLHALLTDKWRSIASDPSPSTAQKIATFAAQRGFEEEVVEEWILQNDFHLE